MSVNKMAKNIGSMSIAVLISRVMGLVRDQIFAYFFGASLFADAFNIAYNIPNLLRSLFGEGALSAAFIPIYQEEGIKKGKEAQIALGLNLVSLLSLLLTVLCILGMLFAPLIVKISAPFFDKPTYDLTLELTYILLPYLFLIGMSSTLISILNSHDYFFLPGLSSAFLNFGMIIMMGLVAYLYPAADKKTMIVTQTWGVILGGILQTVTNFPLLKKVGYRFKVYLSVSSSSIRQVGRKLLPGVWGTAVRQVNLLVDKALASGLPVGSISALNYGSRLMLLPLGVFGAAVGTAAVPHFSRAVALNDYQELARKLRFSLIGLAYTLLPITAVIYGLGRDFIRILFLRGAFDNSALEMSYTALFYYSLGLVFYGFNHTLVPVFYARKNTRTPVYIATWMVLVNVVLNIILMKIMGMAGLALASTVSALIQCFILFWRLKKRIPQLKLDNMALPLVNILAVSVLIAVFLGFANHYYLAAGFWQAMLKSVVLSSCSLFILIVFSLILKIEYAKDIMVTVWKKLRRN